MMDDGVFGELEKAICAPFQVGVAPISMWR
jgi:hypothetical protein